MTTINAAYYPVKEYEKVRYHNLNESSAMARSIRNRERILYLICDKCNGSILMEQYVAGGLGYYRGSCAYCETDHVTNSVLLDENHGSVNQTLNGIQSGVKPPIGESFWT